MAAGTSVPDTSILHIVLVYGAFARTIPLPMAVQADKTTAQLKDGVLEITMPKSEQAKVKEIPTKVS